MTQKTSFQKNKATLPSDILSLPSFALMGMCVTGRLAGVQLLQNVEGLTVAQLRRAAPLCETPMINA